MIKIENTETYGWEAAIRGMRNPLESWEKSDSIFDVQELGYADGTTFIAGENIFGEQADVDENPYHGFVVGNTDFDLMKKLATSGTDHSKFMRMITVTTDIVAPLYWWKEYDTYKIGTVANSCSTMHKIHAKEFTMEDFSHEHLVMNDSNDTTYQLFSQNYRETGIYVTPVSLLGIIIGCLNNYREEFLKTHDKKYWWQMIQLLPSSYNQRRTVQLNYAVLRNIYHARKNHKLDEWREFCEWIETLPYSEIITCETGKEG